MSDYCKHGRQVTCPVCDTDLERRLRELVAPYREAGMSLVYLEALARDAAHIGAASLRGYARHGYDDDGVRCPRHWVEDEECSEDGTTCSCGLAAALAFVGQP